MLSRTFGILLLMLSDDPDQELCFGRVTGTEAREEAEAETQGQGRASGMGGRARPLTLAGKARRGVNLLSLTGDEV